jgi:hypothetical protein
VPPLGGNFVSEISDCGPSPAGSQPSTGLNVAESLKCRGRVEKPFCGSCQLPAPRRDYRLSTRCTRRERAPLRGAPGSALESLIPCTLDSLSGADRLGLLIQ